VAIFTDTVHSVASVYLCPQADPLNDICFVFIIIMLPIDYCVKILKADCCECENERTVFIDIQMPVFDKCMHDTIQSSDGERRRVGK